MLPGDRGSAAASDAPLLSWQTGAAVSVPAGPCTQRHKHAASSSSSAPSTAAVGASSRRKAGTRDARARSDWKRGCRGPAMLQLLPPLSAVSPGGSSAWPVGAPLPWMSLDCWSLVGREWFMHRKFSGRRALLGLACLLRVPGSPLSLPCPSSLPLARSACAGQPRPPRCPPRLRPCGRRPAARPLPPSWHPPAGSLLLRLLLRLLQGSREQTCFSAAQGKGREKAQRGARTLRRPSQALLLAAMVQPPAPPARPTPNLSQAGRGAPRPAGRPAAQYSSPSSSSPSADSAPTCTHRGGQGRWVGGAGGTGLRPQVGGGRADPALCSLMQCPCGASCACALRPTCCLHGEPCCPRCGPRQPTLGALHPARQAGAATAGSLAPPRPAPPRPRTSS